MQLIVKIQIFCVLKEEEIKAGRHQFVKDKLKKNPAAKRDKLSGEHLFFRRIFLFILKQ